MSLADGNMAHRTEGCRQRKSRLGLAPHAMPNDHFAAQLDCVMLGLVGGKWFSLAFSFAFTHGNVACHRLMRARPPALTLSRAHQVAAWRENSRAHYQLLAAQTQVHCKCLQRGSGPTTALL